MTDVNFRHSSQYCKVSLKLCTKNPKYFLRNKQRNSRLHVLFQHRGGGGGGNAENRRSRELSQKAIQDDIQTTLTELTKEGKTLKATY